MNYQRTTTV